MKISVENMLSMYARVRKVYIEEFSRRFQEENFSPNEINIMIFLYNNPSIDTSSKLCVTLGVSKGLISRSIDSLLKKGYMKINIDEHDKRIQHLILTKKAEPIIKRIETIKDEMDEDILKDIPKEDIEIMQRTLLKIKENFEKRTLEGGYEDENV